MSWRKLVPGMFGNVDHRFGGHTSERKVARRLLDEASDDGASFKDILDEVKKHLQNQGDSAEHISDQISRMRDIENWIN